MAAPPQGKYPAPPTKKTNPIVWILAAVVGLFLLIGIAVVAGGLFLAKKASDMAANPGLATMKLMIAANPEIELVSSDEDKGTVTIREKKTGKVLTVNFDQIREGKLSFEQDGEKISMEASSKGNGVEIKGPEGTIQLGGDARLPDWLPAYPGAEAKAVGTQASTSKEQSGMVVFTTTDAPEKVLEFYQAALKKAGIADVSNTTATTSGKIAGMLSGKSEDNRRFAQVLFGTEEGKTSASITYTNKN
jgi:hypothetical protein